MAASDNQPGRTASGRGILWALTGGYRARMGLLAAVSFAGALIEAGFLVLLTGTVLAIADDTHTVGPVLGYSISVPVALGIGAVTVVARLLLSLVGVRVSASLTAEVTTDQRHRLSRAFLGTDWATQQAEPAGRLQELLSSFVSRVTNAMVAMTQAVTAALSLVAFLSTGFVVDPWATIAVLAALAGLGTVLAPLRRAVRRRSAAAARSNLAFANTVAELGAMGQEMQTFGAQHSFASRVDALSRDAVEQARRVQVLSGAMTPVYTFLAYTAVVGGISILSLVGVGELSAIGAVMLLMLRSLSYGQQLVSVSGNLASAVPFLEQLEARVQEYEAHRASSGNTIPARSTPLTAADVSFAYSPERPALSGLTLQIDPGEIVGVIGPSGAGKSTLAQLLLGLRDPSQGAMHVDGVDLREVDRAWWTRRVAFVPQDPLLFTGTVAENIRFFRTELTDADLRRAAEQANVLADIEDLPHGFDTHLGERGSQLSGGQRQRLSIARALVAQPEVLILDEPTSALDGTSEALIRDTLGDLHGRVTIVIIAHRMSTLDLCDRIMVIEHGRMTGFDAPSALRSNSEFFRNALIVAGIA